MSRAPEQAATQESRKARLGLYALALVLPFALFWLFGSMLPAGVEIVAEGDVEAPRELVFELLEGHAGMERWALWAASEGSDLSGGALPGAPPPRGGAGGGGGGGGGRGGPGPAAGGGAGWGWDRGGEAWGSMVVAEANPPVQIVYDVNYGGQQIRRTLTLKDVGSTTTIVWSDVMVIERPMHRWMAIVMDEQAEDSIREAIRSIDGAARTVRLEQGGAP